VSNSHVMFFQCLILVWFINIIFGLLNDLFQNSYRDSTRREVSDTFKYVCTVFFFHTFDLWNLHLYTRNTSLGTV
jgi:hypothetical protein